MRRLVDTNILVHAANEDSVKHAPAMHYLKELTASGESWCLTWGIIYEFLRVATHARVFRDPFSSEEALEFAGKLINRAEVVMLSATPRHGAMLALTVSELSHPAGNLFHDIETAVLMREHGVPEIVTADTDFLQFRFLKVTNPLLSRGR